MPMGTEFMGSLLVVYKAFSHVLRTLRRALKFRSQGVVSFAEVAAMLQVSVYALLSFSLLLQTQQIHGK